MNEKDNADNKTYEIFSKTSNKGNAPTATEMKNKRNPQKEK